MYYYYGQVIKIYEYSPYCFIQQSQFAGLLISFSSAKKKQTPAQLEMPAAALLQMMTGT
jgi:hypothetical protein